ncbi:hypothetical protein GCK32_015860 [Trichostrongylus colubriformis]|uniref:Peptidase S1 domain-containing protein n=1 Tax=Trichostrongylus colubriformis TaxID=6319 RepID=A0AAN8EYH3_TRICO
MLIEILYLSLTASCSRISDKENLSLKKSCGVRTLGSSKSFKIFGGETIKPNEYPWMVHLKIARNDFGKRATTYCSGSLISSRHILTAAHCVMNVDKKRLSTDCIPRFKTDKVKPQDVSAYLKNDVTNKEAAPICLPSADLALAKEVQVAGSGTSESGEDVFKVATLKFVEEGKDRVTIRGKSKGTSGCDGDSGGPLFQLDKNSKYAVVGVYSGDNVKAKKGCGIPGEVSTT